MAIDLGLNRSSGNWTKGSDRIFTEREGEMRDRVWHGLVQLDMYAIYFTRRP